MSLYYVYPLYTSTLAIVLYLLVPQRFIRSLLIYGIIFGATIDFVTIIIVTLVLGFGGYVNYGPFGFMSIPFFPLFAWSCYFILYLYFLPPKPFVYIYPIIAAAYSTLFSNVLQNIGIFKWNYGRILIPFTIYVIWHLTVTCVYIRIRPNDNINSRLKFKRIHH
jgi:hypothetical protein